jgi:hypothetical protein
LDGTTLKVNVPPAVAVPAICPEAGFNDHPEGKDPLDTANVTGAATDGEIAVSWKL